MNSFLDSVKRKRLPDVADYGLSFEPIASWLILNYLKWCSKRKERN